MFTLLQLFNVFPSPVTSWSTQRNGLLKSQRPEVCFYRSAVCFFSHSVHHKCMICCCVKTWTWCLLAR